MPNMLTKIHMENESGGDLKLESINILELSTDTVAQLVERLGDKQSLGSNPSECQIFNLFRRILSSMLPWRNFGRSNFDSG